MTDSTAAVKLGWRHPLVIAVVLGLGVATVPAAVWSGPRPGVWWLSWWVLYAVAAGYSLSGSV